MQWCNKYSRLVLPFIMALLVMAFSADKEYFEVAVGKTRTYFVDDRLGSEYYWTVFNDPDFLIPVPESEAYFPKGNTGHSVEIEWKKEGLYYIAVVESDLSGCMNVKVKAVKVCAGDFTVSAGKDTLIGACNPFQLMAVVQEQEGRTYTYNWEPEELLDDPFSPAPVFTPGSSARFSLTVTDNLGVSGHSAVQINVSETVAEAGANRFISQDGTLQLDGSRSSGEGLLYFWTTDEGKIISGAELVNPVVRGAGLYVLTVTDRFGCTGVDTVSVGLLPHDPMIFDDHDTTEYRTAFNIDVLENDFDPDNRVDRESLRIAVPPLNGKASVDFTDYTVKYVPGKDFSGTDYFSYSVCDSSGNCFEGKVNVTVKELRFFIPEAFSPNNDGFNDYFEIPGIEFFENNSIEIFNRSGKLVYRAEKYGIENFPKFWDAKSNVGSGSKNELLPTGTYFYVIDLGNGEKRILGSVYLAR